MNRVISLATSQGGHSADLPPVDKNEFNEEIYRYLTQIHQQQMQQRAQSSSSAKVPNEVQQALNLNSAFLTFSQKLVEGLIVEQMDCLDCGKMYKAWLLIPSSSDLQEQVLAAVKFLDELVDEHARHAGTEQDDFRIFKLSVSAIFGKLQAGKRLQSRMEDIVKELWPPKESFKRDEVAPPDEMLFQEWKVVKYSLKTLYHHYLYFLKCVEAAEDSIENLDREVVIAQVKWEKERFDQTVSLLPNQFGHRVNKSKQPIKTFFSGFTEISKAMGASGEDVNLPRSEFGAIDATSDRDQSLENIKVPSFQAPKDLVSGNAKIAEEACDRLLKSLSNVTFEESQPDTSSIFSLSETDSLLSHGSKSLEVDTKEQVFTQEQEPWAIITKSWVSLRTGRTGVGSNASANTGIGEEDGEDTPESSRNNNNDNKNKQTVHGQRQSDPAIPRKNIDWYGDGQDNKDENEEDGRERKRQKQTSPMDSRGFACPYYKRDPERHATLKSCFSTNYLNMHRLKEHLYRSHRIPIHCPRCRHIFPKKKSLLNHQRELVSCERQSEPTFEGFDAVQEEQLRSRKQTPKDAVEKWKDIYRILFPEDNELLMPSYYHDVQPTFIDQNDPALKQRVHEELAHYDEYQRQILPALIYSKLSTSDNAGDGINLINVVDECLSESLKHYKLSSRENDQRNAKDGSSAVGISETSTNIQVVGNYEYSNGFPFQNTGLSNTPRFVGNQDLDAEAVSSGVPELGFGWNSEYDSSVSGPIPLGISACEVPEYALDQTTGEDGNTI